MHKTKAWQPGGRPREKGKQPNWSREIQQKYRQQNNKQASCNFYNSSTLNIGTPLSFRILFSLFLNSAYKKVNYSIISIVWSTTWRSWTTTWKATNLPRESSFISESIWNNFWTKSLNRIYRVQFGFSNNISINRFLDLPTFSTWLIGFLRNRPTNLPSLSSIFPVVFA